MLATPTETQDSEALKAQVRAFWNQQSCDTQVARGEKFSKEYFEDIEAYRYFDQYFIHSFAQFSRYHGKRVLEVGFGAGTDFTQWLRSGAIASGIDLTQEALDNLTHRIKAYGLPQPESIQVGDAENLPFDSNRFDLGYSFGVLHASPNTEKAVRELIRVVKPGGEIKIMVYNRYSVFVFNQWVKLALLKAKPWKSLRWVLWNHIESIGMKGYTAGELARWFSGLPLENIHIHTDLTSADCLSASAFPPLNRLYRLLIRLAGPRFGWHPGDYVARGVRTHKGVGEPIVRGKPGKALITGHRLGFFHNISARKK